MYALRTYFLQGCPKISLICTQDVYRHCVVNNQAMSTRADFNCRDLNYTHAHINVQHTVALELFYQHFTYKESSSAHDKCHVIHYVNTLVVLYGSECVSYIYISIHMIIDLVCLPAFSLAIFKSKDLSACYLSST